MGLPILPHLLRQMPSRIVDYSGTTSSLYLRQPRQSLNLGITGPESGYDQKNTSLQYQDTPPSPSVSACIPITIDTAPF
jgi:hypothetical protein